MRKRILTIAALELLLTKQRSAVDDLVAEREAIDSKIAAMIGTGKTGNARTGTTKTGKGATRAKNTVSLPDTMEAVLKRHSKPLGVQEIVAAVLKHGYKTNSANFRGIVNQTLIKDGRFKAADRGVYQLA